MVMREIPLVSIIIPAYNVENTIENCIKSIRIQTYDKIEIIVVDDGSSDCTYNVVNMLAENDKRVKIFRQSNKGVSAARNRGIQEATGEFIIFVDADDSIMINMIEILINKQREFNVDLVQCAILHIFDEKHKQVLSDIIVNRYRSKEEIKKYFYKILNNELNSPVGKLYKKEIIQKKNILFDVQLEVSEDLCFNLQYLEQISSMIYIPDVLYNYYLYNSFLTKKYKKDLFDMRKIAIVILDEFLIRNEIERTKTYFLYVKLVFAAAMQEVEHNKNRKERYKEIRINLKRPEVKEAIEKCKLQWNMERLLCCIIKSESPMFIDLISHIFIFARKNRFLKIKRISV